VTHVDKEQLKRAVVKAIDSRRDELIALGQRILAMPELGYKEHRTAEVVEGVMRSMGLSYRKGLAVTGLKAVVSGQKPGPRIGILGELDAVVCPGHPNADPLTGAAHACGHNGQLTSMLGAGMGLIDSGVMKELAGSIALMAVPAEEPVEIEYRQKLRENGKIRFLGGKQELIALGEFDDIDIAMMVHMTAPDQGKKARMGGTANGFIAKLIKYKGKEAHAGGAPHLGVNALNAAMLGLMGIHAQRETFKDDDSIRVHPIITKGGDLVNVIPADVRIETYVRGKTIEGILDASRKVNRALRAGAMAIGGDVEIIEIPGFLPVDNNRDLSQLFRGNLEALIGAEFVADAQHGAGSTDMADVMTIMPAIHPYIGGATGRGHSEDYIVTDPELAYIVPAKALALSAVDLLYDGAGEALRIKSEFKPRFTKETYLKMWQDLVNEK
jgi:amidohydrolase